MDLGIHGLDQLSAYLPFVLPLLMAEFGLMIFCLVDIQLSGRRVRGGNKLVWRLVVICLTTIGSLVYLFWGREDE